MSETDTTSVICPQCGATVLDAARFCGMCGAAVVRPSERDPYAGEVVAGRYRIQRRIASGGMGQVYVAQHETLGQQVAVKLLHRRFASDEKVVARFFNEARSYCRVKHPHAVGILDFGRLNDGTLYIVTEFVEGLSLAKLVARDGPLSPALVVRLARQLAEVLAAAHDEQVVHRDLKPDNVMVTEGPGGRLTVKVLDFGIAKILDDDGQRLTRTGSVFGTPEFMSPEQAQGKRVDARSDLYSLGALLFFLLTGQAPFRADKRTDLLQKHVAEPPPLDELRQRPDMPRALVALLGDLLEKSPGERPPDMLAVLGRLESLQAVVPEPEPPAKLPVVATPPAAPEEPAITPESAEAAAATRDEADRPTRRRVDTPAGQVEKIGEAGLNEALTSAERDALQHEDFVFDLGGSGEESSDAYTWGDDESDVDTDDPFKRALDVDTGEVPISALDTGGSPVPWILALLLLIGGAIGGYLFMTSGSGHAGNGAAAGTGDGTGATAGVEAPPAADAGQPDVAEVEAAGQVDAGSLDGRAAVAEAGASPDRPRAPAGVPAAVAARTSDLIEASRLAGLVEVLLQTADVNDATDTWRRAEALLERSEQDDPSLPIATRLERARDLVASARAALEANECRRADRAIVEMREISPALRRAFLGPLHDCNRRREEARSGRPPRTLE